MASAQDRDIVLIVEDDPITLKMVGGYLGRNGLVILKAQDCATARKTLADTPVHLVLLDIRLPDGSGRSLAREIRAMSDIGIIFMTFMGDTEDRVVGLEIGADDYVTKPIEMRELLAPVRSTLRRIRATNRASTNGVVKLGAWEIDLRRREAVGADGSIAALTRAEFDIVAALVQAEGQAVSRDYLLDVVSRRSLHIGDRTVDTLISRIRQKLEPGAKAPHLILTERGIGYRANTAP
jgi:two-component system torCAD operon response regulator TorR